MAEIAAIRSSDNNQIKWEGVGNGDTFGAAAIANGKHTVEVRSAGADFDGAVIDIHHAFDGSAYAALDTDAAPDGLRFSSDSAANLEIGGGSVKPVFQTAGGGAEDITIIIRRI